MNPLSASSYFKFEKPLYMGLNHRPLFSIDRKLGSTYGRGGISDHGWPLALRGLIT